MLIARSVQGGGEAWEGRIVGFGYRVRGLRCRMCCCTNDIVIVFSFDIMLLSW